MSARKREHEDLLALLYDNVADVILPAHDHDYERVAPQTPNGDLNAAHGIREFVVGTGGANHTSFVTTAANSDVRNSTTFGVLKGQQFTDSGTEPCHP